MFDIITIGTGTRDVFVKSKNFNPVSDDKFTAGKGFYLSSGDKLEIDEMHFTTGGGATNMASTFARQGLNSAVICEIGPDASGRAVLDSLKEEGINIELVVTEKDSKTGYSVILLSEEGDRTVLVFRGASRDIETSSIDWSNISAKWFYLSGSLSKEIIEGAVKQSHNMGAKIAFGPSSVHLELGLVGLENILSTVDVLVLNREEAAKLTKIDFSNEKDIFKKLNDNIRGIVVMTEGPKGVLVSNGKQIWQAGVFKEKVIADRTGAGDAFGSGFVAALKDVENIKEINPETMEHAIRLASANATSVVEHVGTKTGILTREDFEKDERWQELKISVNQNK